MEGPPQERLDSWKEIAEFLRRDITTVIRWEKQKGLPVHRVPGGTRHAVFAYKAEIDAWLKNGAGRGALQASVSKPTRHLLVGAGVAVLLVVAAAVLFRHAAEESPPLLEYKQLTNDGRTKTGGLVTDGARLYFVEDLATGAAIVQLPTAGGETQVVSRAFEEPVIQDLSRARAELLVSDPVIPPGIRPPLWALSLSGGLPRRVGNIVADSAAYSPDGARIAYGVGKEIYVSNSDGTEARKIATFEGRVAAIRWSPDGGLLRVTVEHPTAVTKIWEVRPDGSNLRPMLGGWHDSEGKNVGSWTPDGRIFFFTTRQESNLWALPETRGIIRWPRRWPVRLSTGPLRVGGPVPSIDGQRVFFVGSVLRTELAQFDSARNEFLPYLAGIPASEASFSRDGGWIAFVNESGGGLWKRRSDGSQPTQLLSGPMRAELPRWSPDGKWIAFMEQEKAGALWQVCIISADGGAMRPVLPSSISQGAPTWSPDGQQVMFGELLEPAGKDLNRLTIHVVDLKTGKATSLPGSEGLWTARWSPDGRYAAALTADSRSIMLYDFKMQAWSKLAPNRYGTGLASAGVIRDLNWSKKSDALYFLDSSPPAGPGVFRVAVRHGRVKKIANLAGPGTFIPRWLGLAPDDSPMVSVARGNTEIYELKWRGQ